MRKPPFPPVPIPEDMLDPRDMNGVQPSPYDIRYKNRFGQVFDFGNGGSAGIKAQSEYITEWVVKMLPPQEAIAAVAAGEGFGYRAFIQANYDAEQFTEHQLLNTPDQLAIPLCGIAVGVHGRLIQLAISRNAPGATGNMIIQCAIVPGRPSLTYVNRSLTVPPGGTENTAIPRFATRFWVNGTISAGDTLAQLNASGAGTVQTITLAAGQVGPFPIHPEAAFVRYGSAAGKIVVVGFEVNS